MADKLFDHVKVNRQFLRSIRLDSDFGRSDAVHGYILQPSAQNVLSVMSKHLLETEQRAFTWTGPYGGGKSSLALLLASLVANDATVRNAAREVLVDPVNKGVLSYFNSKKQWAVLPVVGKRASIVDEIGSVIDQNALLRSARGRRPQQDGRRNVIAELVRAAGSRDDVGGVLLIIDELGKFLEHAAHSGEDIGFYQDLAEAACRCKGKLVVIGVLHQAFEQYASRLGEMTHQEWKKVQGRYADIPLVAGADEVVSLLGRALDVSYRHKKQSADVAARVANVIRVRRPSASSNIAELLNACWPLHPVTAAMLGPASKKRFGQNERSVFSFLASAEPLGFIEFIRGATVSPSSYYWPHQFWDYLRVNFEPAILASPDGHRWAGCAEAIERTEARFSSLHVNLVKTVSLIEILRNGSGLAAEDDLLTVSTDALQGHDVSVAHALNELCAASILIYRKHLNAYGVTAGSDFDIEAAIRDAKGRIAGFDISDIGNLIDLSPITARRHYWETGAMRWFSRRIVLESQAEKYIKNFSVNGGQSGEFLLVIGWKTGDNEVRQQRTRKLAKAASEMGLLVGVPSSVDRIEDLVGELAALEYVRKNSQTLDGDSIARREIDGRLQSIRAMLSDELRDAFQAAIWYHSVDKQHTKRYAKEESLSLVASQVASVIYSGAPHVHSELINRDALSSNAAKAQRELLHAMLSRSDQPFLGYTSFSADAGLYHTVVKALGLHRMHKGVWGFLEPAATDNSASMVSAWNAAKNAVFNTDKITGLDEIYRIWTSPPLGVKAGLLPIFALAFFLAYRSQLALHIENVFTPDVTEAHVDEWLQDPKRIGWRHVRIDATERKMLQLLSAALSKRLGFPVADDALDTARALVAQIFDLPDWTRRTSLVSQDAQEVRRLLLRASDPHKVLFADLPLILKTRDPQVIATRLAEITGELAEAYEVRLRVTEKKLLAAIDHQEDDLHLNERGRIVMAVGSDFRVRAFATRLASYGGELEDVQGLLMLALEKPPEEWTDNDVDAGEVQLLSWALEFRRLESLAILGDRPSTRRAIGVVFGARKTVTGTFDISDKDDDRAQKLAKDLLQKLSENKVKREVILAAIAEVGATIFDELTLQRGDNNE